MEMNRAFAELTLKRLENFAKPNPDFDMSEVYKYGMEMYAFGKHTPAIYWMPLDEADVDKEAYTFSGKYDLIKVYSNIMTPTEPVGLRINEMGELVPVSHFELIPKVKPTAISMSEFYMLIYFRLLFHGASSHFTKTFNVDSITKLNDLAVLVRKAMPLYDTIINFVKDLDSNRWIYATYAVEQLEQDMFEHPRCMINVNNSFFE